MRQYSATEDVVVCDEKGGLACVVRDVVGAIAQQKSELDRVDGISLPLLLTAISRRWEARRT
jgi:mannose/fructose-specific phosphotransferase system component IIA